MHKIASIQINQAPPFSRLTIRDLPPTAKLVVMLGPNGCGKTSVFQALRNSSGPRSPVQRHRPGMPLIPPKDLPGVHVRVHGQPDQDQSVDLYLRTAYRADHTPITVKQPATAKPTRGNPPARLSQPDPRSLSNRQALIDAANNMALHSSQNIYEAMESLVTPVRERFAKMFPGLRLDPVKPLPEGPPDSFKFMRGTIPISFEALSSGEREIFDLLLDMELWAKDFSNSVFCIDEPELHVHTSLQAELLMNLLEFIPDSSQLWIATHSIGIIRRAMDLFALDNSQVVFLEFAADIATTQDIGPSIVDRNLWRRALRVAVADLAGLVSPSHIVVCEGRPKDNGKPKHPEFDAKIYRKIFGDKYPNSEFVSAGNTNDVLQDTIRLQAALQLVVPDLKIERLIDRDNNSSETLQKLRKSARVLSRYSIENYLWSDEILTKLMEAAGLPPDDKNAVLALKQSLVKRVSGNPEDPLEAVKDADGRIYKELMKHLALKGHGNTPDEFAFTKLVPLITPDTATYKDLESAIFADVSDSGPEK